VLRDPWRFALAAGSQRKETGSYYTPPELVRELAMIRSGEAEPAPETYRAALREVIRHCLCAVDKNPLAVDLCKVALWIEGHAPGLPLSFLDHRIRRGDSLVGVFDLDVLKAGVPDAAFKQLTGDDKAVCAELRKRNREERKSPLDTLSAETALVDPAGEYAALADLPDETAADVRSKEELYRALTEGEKSAPLLPLTILAAGGTRQMQSLAGKGGALRQVLGDRLVFAFADNDREGRELVEHGQTKKGGQWRQQSNGIHWCLLAPTAEFEQAMKRFAIHDKFLAVHDRECLSGRVASASHGRGCLRRRGSHGPGRLPRRPGDGKKGADRRPSGRRYRRRRAPLFPAADARDQARLR
jgi:hypothetical protein